ncbi:MAG: TasA family protein [Herbiconiux sp.]|nr:TasA family protein [Herbiconiux sp.]
MTNAAGGRHALSRRGARPSLARRMMMVVMTAGAATALAVVASGGTYALFNSTASTAGGTLRAGTATLSVSTLTLDAARLNPGGIALGTATVQNTGNVKLALRLSGVTRTSTSTAYSSALLVGVSAVDPAVACPATPAASTWSHTFAEAAAASPAVVPAELGIVLAKETGTAKLCVSVQLPSTASAATNIVPATSVAFTVQLDGRQVN